MANYDADGRRILTAQDIALADQRQREANRLAKGLDPARTSTGIAARRGRLYSTRDGWMVKGAPALVGQAAPCAPITYRLDRDVDYSVSGLGAYRSYRRYPGKHFPNRGLTVSTTAGEKASRGKGARTIHDSL